MCCCYSRAKIYPLEPKGAIDAFLILVFLAIIGFVSMIYAEMHRDSILSHLTKTTPGEMVVRAVCGRARTLNRKAARHCNKNNAPPEKPSYRVLTRGPFLQGECSTNRPKAESRLPTSGDSIQDPSHVGFWQHTSTRSARSQNRHGIH